MLAKILAMYDPKTTGAAIRKARLARGMSMAELARQAGTRHGHISLIENGKIAAGNDLIARIADALGVSLDELFGREGPMDALDPQLEQIQVNLKAIKRLDPEKIDELADIILAVKEKTEREAQS